MYGFKPSDEQAMLVETVNRYEKSNLRSAAHEAEETRQLPPKLISKGWELGVVQAAIPEAYGGFGERSLLTAELAVEELGFGDLAGALAVLSPSAFVTPLLLAGSEEQKKQHIPGVIEADWKPYTAALLEPVFDFDPNDLKTVAKKVAGGYQLDGAKTSVPYAAEAEALIVYAALDGATRAFIVPAKSQGLKISDRIKLMSLNALPLYDVTLQGLRVPAAGLLPGDFAPILAAMRVTNSALALGVARAAFEYARDYAKEREAFGVKIAQKQAVAFMLAEMATEIEAMRLLNWEAAWKLDTGKADAAIAAYLAATGAADMAMMVTDRAVQILGGHGYIRDHPVEMWMRNGRSFASLTGLALV